LEAQVSVHVFGGDILRQDLARTVNGLLSAAYPELLGHLPHAHVQVWVPWYANLCLAGEAGDAGTKDRRMVEDLRVELLPRPGDQAPFDMVGFMSLDLIEVSFRFGTAHLHVVRQLAESAARFTITLTYTRKDSNWLQVLRNMTWVLPPPQEREGTADDVRLLQQPIPD
jgi:hypothetical protein